MLVLSPSYSGRAWVKLGDVNACKMHTWTLHFITCYSMLFASYKGYIHDLYWVLGIINNFPIFLELTLRCQKTPFSIFWCFRDTNDVQMTWNFTGIIFLEGTKRRRKGIEETETRRPKGVGPRGQIPWPRGVPHPGPRASAAVDLSSRSFVLT